MPTYQYECESCQHVFEVLQSMTDKKLKKCPKCGKMSLIRHIGTGAGVIFKGTGFYETDYKTKSPAPAAAPSGGHCHSGGCGCASGASGAPASSPKAGKNK